MSFHFSTVSENTGVKEPSNCWVLICLLGCDAVEFTDVSEERISCIYMLACPICVFRYFGELLPDCTASHRSSVRCENLSLSVTQATCEVLL
jgi:hypothetical protein